MIAGTDSRVPKFYKNMHKHGCQSIYIRLILYTFKNKVKLYNNKKTPPNLFPQFFNLFPLT